MAERQEGSRYHFSYLLEGELGRGAWIEASGRSLPYPVRIRLNKAPSGRLLVTALRIEAGDQEITADDLRTIKLRELVRSFWDSVYAEAGEPLVVQGDSDDSEWWAWLFREFLIEDILPAAGVESGADAQLRRFAGIYHQALAREPMRAMTMAAKEMNVSRSTANRWAAQCRERGYLPKRESP